MNDHATLLGPRRAILLFILLAGVIAWIGLGLRAADLDPGKGGQRLMGRFFHAAFSPALVNEDPGSFASSVPLWRKALGACGETIRISAAAVSLSLVLGLLLGFFASTAWWSGEIHGGASPLRRLLNRWVAPVLYGCTRVFITFIRSIHELLWATLFLAAFGMSPLAAVIAITLPYTGTFAKIYSEMIDEANTDAASTFRAIGASPMQVMLFGLIPPALSELVAYTLYRFECGLRSSAVMGFMGVTTIGYHLGLSFENRFYHEVWTYLYALLIMVVIFEKWSDLIRRGLREGAAA